ncbi:MAG TPA: hypothetical protein VG847_04940 [Chitinophagaceae bacterium]|nr:hypothetical protein [Chitinophagaceae bacterium]
MKHLKFLTLIFLSTVFLFSCSGNTNNETSSSSDKKTTQPSTATSSAGDASWSCVIDGQPVSGGLTDNGLAYDYQRNVAFIDDVDKGKELLFYLLDTKTADSPGVHTLRFSVPAKTGVSSFGPDEDAWGIQISIDVNKNHTAIYNSDSFTINVTSLSASRVSGTFSGKFKFHGNIDDTDKNEIEVTDGKFDIPVSNR